MRVRLRARAPGKVNLCLFLGGLRADGRHELVTLVEAVSLADELTVLAGSEIERDEVICSGVEGPNLVSSALELLRDSGWDGPPLQVEISKRIPVAAGMAGGSADAAAALRMAEMVAHAQSQGITRIAEELGSDVPSQLSPGLVRVSGRGEIVEELEPLASHAFVLVPLPFALSTADVYEEADRLGLPRDADDLATRATSLDAALAPDAVLPGALIVNDLGRAAVSLCPAIVEALDAVRGVEAEQAIVCGSGPTVAGIWWGPRAKERAASAARQLHERYPGAVSATPVTQEFALPRRE